MAKNLENEFVSYEQALALKELGFDEPCLSRFNPDNEIIISYTETYNGEHRKSLFTQAPLKQQVFDFFREKYGLYHIIHCPIKDVSNFTITGFDIPSVFSDVELKSYKEAENACIDKLIELVKQDKNERTI